MTAVTSKPGLDMATMESNIPTGIGMKENGVTKDIKKCTLTDTI